MSSKTDQQITVRGAVPYVALGGAIGAGLRYLLLELSPFSPDFSYLVIMAENITGSLFLGLLAGLISRAKLNTWPWAPFLGTGILGSFTTFSTFITDIVYLSSSSVVAASLYIGVSIVAGLLAAAAGFSLSAAVGKTGGGKV